MTTAIHPTVLATPGIASVLQVASGPEQYVLTVLVGVAFLGYIYGVYRLGRHLKANRDDDLVEILQALGTTAGAILASLAVAVVWELYDAVEEAYQQFLIEPVTAILLLVTFVAIAVTYTLTRVTKRLVKYASGRVQVTPHQRELIHHVVQLTLFLAVAAFIFALWDFDPTNLLLGAGVLGIVLGFAARKTLSGVLAGFVILFSRPFEVGDWIAVGDREGIVTEITVYNTELRTFNEEHVIVPNDALTENEVVNFSKTSRLRRETEIGVDYDDDLAEAAAVAVEAMESCEAVSEAPAPDVVLDSFADSAVVLRLRFWIDRPTSGLARRAQNEVVEAVKLAFEREGIKIPYPQRELTGREEAGGLRVATDDRSGVDEHGADGRDTTRVARDGVDVSEATTTETDATDGAAAGESATEEADTTDPTTNEADAIDPESDGRSHGRGGPDEPDEGPVTGVDEPAGRDADGSREGR